MDKIGAFFSRYKVKFVVLIFIGLVPLIIYNSAYHLWNSLIGYCNSFFISGGLLIGLGLLSFCGGFGTFDIFSYLFMRQKDPITHVHEDFYAYVERKKENRKSNTLGFVPYLIVGALYLILAFIFYSQIH